MKYAKGQKTKWSGSTLNNATTILLDGGLSEAIDLLKAQDLLSDNALANPSRFSDFDSIVAANKAYAGECLSQMKYNLRSAVSQIGKIPSNKQAEITALTEEFYHKALEIDPSLSLDPQFQMAEEGDMWDAGAIAEGKTLCMITKTESSMPKTGKGDGCFRIVINTDCPWSACPTRYGAALTALAMILQRIAPVEVWVQQGWLGSNEKDGVTLFRICSGASVSVQNLWFWTSSPLKDMPFSYAINRCLGRRHNGCSTDPEIECDLYIHGSMMPEVHSDQDWQKWIAQTAKPILSDHEIGSGWTGATLGQVH